jgi:tRNA G18 (ribose-2'-O)-methylase SpoU
MKKNLILILPDIRSAQNVGSIFRTGDAVGVEKIYLTGYTATPIDRFGRPRSDINKASLGAEKTVDWEYVENTIELLNKLKKENYKIIGLEQDERSVDYKSIVQSADEKIALIIGNEVLGISKNILDACDTLIEIPMVGEKESLNVSVATGIVLYHLLDR